VAAPWKAANSFEKSVGGGNAIVYLARDLQHSRDVAVKVIRQGVPTGIGGTGSCAKWKSRPSCVTPSSFR
jgi:hypothetical protein